MADLRAKDLATLERRRIDRRYDAIIRLGSLLIGRGLKWGYFGYLTYAGQRTLSSFAGKDTFTSVIVSLGSNVSVAVGASWAVTIGLVIWVFLERRLRKGTTERLHVRIKDLELQIDRKRTSSELTPRGETRPEDQT